MAKDDDLPAGKPEEKPMAVPDMAKLPPLRDRDEPVNADTPAMKLWVVSPNDPHEPPFHFSNTPNTMLVAAEDERKARNLARIEAGHAAWGDVDKVLVEEFMPKAAMVLTRNLRM